MTTTRTRKTKRPHTRPNAQPRRNWARLFTPDRHVTGRDECGERVEFERGEYLPLDAWAGVAGELPDGLVLRTKTGTDSRVVRGGKLVTQ